MQRPIAHYAVIASLALLVAVFSTVLAVPVNSILAQSADEQAAMVVTSVATPTAQATPVSTAPFYPLLVEVDGQYGFIDASGKLISQPQYDFAYPFSEGLAAVQVNNQWGFIDGSGKMVIPPQFPLQSAFLDGRAVVRLNGKEGWIDKTGKFFDLHLPDTLLNGFIFSEGLAAIEVGDRNPYGGAYIDQTGKIIIGFQFTNVQDFHEGLAAARNFDYGWGYIDHTGRYVIQPKLSYSAVGDFSEGLASFVVHNAATDDYTAGYIDKTGQIVIPPQFGGAFDFSEGLALVWLDNPPTKWAYVDKSGKLAFPSQFPRGLSFSEGLARVKVGNKWGYIDHMGEFAIQPQFDDFPDDNDPLTWARSGSFHGGFAQVEVGDKSGYIDRTGKFIWQPSK